MTQSPAVTVVDPHGPAPRPAVVTRRWSLGERVLALLLAAVLAVGLLSARSLRAHMRNSPMVADAGRLTFVLDSPSYLRLELVVSGPHEELQQVREIRSDSGWVLLGEPPRQVAPGLLLMLSHPVDCSGSAPFPKHLKVRTEDGVVSSLKVLRVDVRPLDSCDPVAGPDAVVALASSSTRTRLRLPLVNISTTSRTLSQVAYPGYDLHASVPLPIPGRDRRRPLSLATLHAQDLEVRARVVDCPVAKRQLDADLDTGDPSQLSAVVDGTTITLLVTGVTAYLGLVWRATCVR